MTVTLVTGGAGFIGANFVVSRVNQGLNGNKLLVLDKLTYAANVDYLAAVADHIDLVEGDITDVSLVTRLFNDNDITQVFHFAAESHVDNSIADPGIFVRTNVVGTQVLLDAARTRWMESPFNCRKGYDSARFLHVSTDEVFGTLGTDGVFSESSPYAPNSPYSASKAASDFLVRSYFHTYGMNVVTTNCSNNYGPGQHDEKLIPTIIRSALAGKPIPIYGTGENIRDWLYVGDHCDAIQVVFDRGVSGDVYLVGSRNEWTNIRIATFICELLDRKVPRANGGSYSELITYVADRPGHDLRYAIDPSKLENELGWTAATSFDLGLNQTVDWYLERYQ